MAAKRCARRPRSDDSKDLGRNGGNEGSNDRGEVSGKSGEDAIPAEPKEMPLKRAEQPSPLSPEDAGAQGSGEASPCSGAALKTKATTSKRVKKPPPASQEEDAAGDSGDASPAWDPLPDDTADAGHKKRAATPKRGEKRSPPPQQEEERPEKRAAGPDGETVAASAPQSKRSADEDRRKNKKKKQQEKKITEQEHANDTSPPHDKDMHTAHGEEQQEEVANQEHADDTSPPKDNHCADEDQEDEETGAQVNAKALQRRNAPSTKPRSSKTEKKPAVERSWSYDDELKILNALIVHAQSHSGALPNSSHLLENLTFDKIDANEDKLTDKIRKLRTRYHRFHLQGCPSDDLGRQLFKLSEILWGQVNDDERVEPEILGGQVNEDEQVEPEILWGQVNEDERVEPTSRDFSVLSKLYPHLAKEVKAYAETHSSGHLIMAMFMTIDDEKARDLDAKCKKQQIEAFKLELGQTSLTNELLSALSSLTRVKF